MTSIYKKVLGTEFEKLHPEIQKRFGFCSEDRMLPLVQELCIKFGSINL
jgi:hypothetical protein